MKKCIVIPDSFKGNISSAELCEISRGAILKVFPECGVVTVPVADGGEGTVDCFVRAKNGRIIKTSAAGPFMSRIESFYGRFDSTAVIEMAAAAGLPLTGKSPDPKGTTTYGVGELIRHAVEGGASEIILGMGGSATNDGGCGCAAALGVEFTDENGDAFVPVGATLDKICGIDVSKALTLLKNVKITAMCDVNNPLLGKLGASAVFAPQKGADSETVEFLEAQLSHFNEVVKKTIGVSFAKLPGAGAAGGFGAGAAAFLGAELKSGIETVLDCVGFDALLENTDIVFTGEGKIDSQSLNGKAVSGICARAAKKSVPVCVVAGDIGDGAEGAYSIGACSVFSINRAARPFSEAKKSSRRDFESTLLDILNLIKISEKISINP